MPMSTVIPNNEQMFMKLNDLEIRLNSFKAEMESLKTNLTKKTDRHDVHIAKLMARIERIEDDSRLTPTSSFASDVTDGSSGGALKRRKKKGKKKRTNRR